MKKKVSIIKYSKAGNIGSLRNTILRITDKKFDICLTDNSVDIKKSDIIILPGVGNFKETMEDLTNKNLIKSIKNHYKKNKFLLGICVGMQVLFEHSEEGNCKGLGLLKGKVKKIKTNEKLPIIGWKKNYSIYKNAIYDGNRYFYFLHSYEVKVIEKKIKQMYYLNGKTKTVSVIKHNNVLATQFHPELSAETGLEFLNYFFSSFVK